MKRRELTALIKAFPGCLDDPLVDALIVASVVVLTVILALWLMTSGR
jgi:hypothetical protein